MISYIAKNGISQFKILMNREDINVYLKENKTSLEEEKKLKLIIKVRDFCFNELKLKKTKNYSSYVQLKDPYVSYLLRVAPKYELKTYKWSFPIVGTFPYLGFFNKNDALEEQKKFIKKDYDTYVRGVTAFSTLGWFTDPVLSSMLNYNEHDLVDLIIHETLHSTLFIKDNTEFNEKLATFLAQKGTELFYKKIEGDNSKTNELIKKEIKDDRTFSKFITHELQLLKKWYQTTENISDLLKEERLSLLQKNFKEQTIPKMLTNKYTRFSEKKLNNANLLPYLTYMADLSDFEKLYTILDKDFYKTLDYLKNLEKSKSPMQDLQNFIK